jgi:protoporphyrinogen oxidase
MKSSTSPAAQPAPLVILGAGVAGLAAALRWTRLHPHHPVILLEASQRPGGLASGWIHKDFAADLGPHRIFTELPEIEELLPELIAQEQLLVVKRTSQMLLADRFVDYPLKALDLLHVFGPKRMAKFALSALQGKLQKLRGLPARDFQTVMRQAFGSGLSALVVEPYAEKVWKTPPDRLDAEVARVRVSAGNITKLLRQIFGRPEPKGQESALREFRYIRGGVHALVQALQTKVEAAGGRILLGHRVTGLEVDPTTGTILAVNSLSPPQQKKEKAPFPQPPPIVTSADALLAQSVSSSDAVPTRHPASAVISTIPLPELHQLAQAHLPTDTQAQEAATNLPYLGLVLVALVLPRPRLSSNCWLYFPDPNLIFNRAYEPANFDPSMAPNDQTMVVFEVTTRWEDPLWQSPVEAVIEKVRADATRIGLIKPGECQTSFAIKVPHTYPVYETGYRQRMVAVVNHLAALPNLITTGRQGLYNHNNMDHSMLMGMRAAEQISRYPQNPAQTWAEAILEFDRFRIVD